jgi:hypothetical protein
MPTPLTTHLGTIYVEADDGRLYAASPDSIEGLDCCVTLWN